MTIAKNPGPTPVTRPIKKLTRTKRPLKTSSKIQPLDDNNKNG